MDFGSILMSFFDDFSLLFASLFTYVFPWEFRFFSSAFCTILKKTNLVFLQTLHLESLFSEIEVYKKLGLFDTFRPRFWDDFYFNFQKTIKKSIAKTTKKKRKKTRNFN